MKFFILKEDYRGFSKGTILLKGSEANPSVTDEKGIEYFDMTDEITTGKSYSMYGVPEELLIPAENQEQLSDGFNSFIDGNYYASEEVKELFKLRNI
jgi:hypothetical protein